MTVRGVRASTKPGVQAGRTDTLALWRTALILALCAACASRGTTPPPAGIPTAVVPPSPVASIATRRWRLATPTSSASYVIESRTIIAAHADSLTRVDTLDAHTTATVIPRGAAVDVTIVAYTVQPSGAAVRALDRPARAVGRFGADGGVIFEGAGRANCATITQTAIETTRDLWVKWPATPVPGDRWRDSAAVGICRDNVPLQLTIVREYRLTSVSGDSVAPTLNVDRRSTLRVSGYGAIRGDTVTISGDGTGTATLQVSSLTGWITDGRATSTLRLTTRSAARTQVVDQHVTQVYRQLPDSARFP